MGQASSREVARSIGRYGLLMTFLCVSPGYAGDVGGTEELPSSAWQHFVSVRALGGYKDNVLLSAELPEGSPFVGGGIELIGWRPVGERGEFQGFAVGEHRQFFNLDQVDHEQTLVTQARYQHDLGGNWTLLMPVDYLYIDQVLDVSATEVEVRATRVQGHTASVSPALQRQVGLGTVELEIAGLRQFYAAPLDDSWELSSRLEWQVPVGTRTQTEVYYDFAQRWYDNDPQLTSEGYPIPGTQRKMQYHDVGAKLRQDWGEDRAWRATLGVSGRYATDHAGGYYDYLRPAASAQLVYQDKGWRLAGTARARYYAYREQQVSAVDDARRRRSELVLEFRGEREIFTWLQVVAEYVYEQTFANRPVEAYHVNTVSCGLEVLF